MANLDDFEGVELIDEFFNLSARNDAAAQVLTVEQRGLHLLILKPKETNLEGKQKQKPVVQQTLPENSQ